MVILLLVARAIFLLLIYLFMAAVLFYIIKDLQRPDANSLQAGEIGVGNLASLGPGFVGADGRTGGAAGVLRVESAPAQYNIVGAEIALTDAINIGRDQSNDVVLPGGFVSGQHARVYLQHEQYWLEDRDSKNGTLLNGVPVKKATVLVNGDQIVIGDITLKFVRWGYEVG